MTEKEKDDEAKASAEETTSDESGSQSVSDEESANNTDDATDSKTPDDDDGDERDEDDNDGDDDDDDESAAAAHAAPSREEASGGSRPLLIGVLCLLAGFGTGWFGQQYQIQKAVKTADAAVEGEGDAARGPCKDWETKICSDLGDTAFACVQARSASQLLSGSACSQAQKSLTQTLEKIKAARASCDTLTTKLCGELGEESAGCGIVKAQTPTFAPQRCTDMMTNYDQVVGQLKMMEQRGGMPGGGMRPPGHPPVRSGPPGSGPPGSGPAGGPPGASPGGPTGAAVAPQKLSVPPAPKAPPAAPKSPAPAQ